MIAENKDIVNLNDIEYETDYFVNSYDYKFVTFIRVITRWMGGVCDLDSCNRLDNIRWKF